MMKAMILAAGEGKRMRPLTDTVPKPLLPIQGKAMIEHHIDHLVAAHFNELVINVSYLGEQIVRHVGALAHPSLRVHFSREADLLETGGGIFNALPLLGNGPFVIVNGDIWTDYPLQDLSLPEGKLAHLVLVENPPQHSVGDFGFSDGTGAAGKGAFGDDFKSPVKSSRTPRYGTLKEQAEEQYTYSGIAVLHPKLFEACEMGHYSYIPLLRQAMQSGAVSGELYLGRWFDIGTPQRLQAINDLLSDGEEASAPLA